jgi:hypothetical protein
VSSVSNGLYFLTLSLVSVMRVIYTSKGMSKRFGCALYIRCALSIEKYGITNIEVHFVGYFILKTCELLFASHLIETKAT